MMGLSGYQMTTNLCDLLVQREKKAFATNAGTLMHSKLQRIIIDTDTERGDIDLIQKIKSLDILLKFFKKSARTEVPVAARQNGQIVSRRIDRVIVNSDAKTVLFLDYKTDLNQSDFKDKYIYQMNEYAGILRNIYPDYSVSGFILWLHDWELEKIV